LPAGGTHECLSLPDKPDKVIGNYYCWNDGLPAVPSRRALCCEEVLV
jgi:hypothetical protein